MGNKITIKDVAEKAGVSKATVSYVLNNREDQSISEATKKKVWQVVNMLNYRPNSFAQNMRVNQEKKMIAVFFPNHLTILEKLSYFDFLEDLKQVFYNNKYEILLLSNTPERVNTADAIITFGLRKEEFYALGDCNLIPLISIDCIIEDPLFFEIYHDYNSIKEKADSYFKSDYTYICTQPRDIQLKQVISSTFANVLFVDTVSSLSQIKGNNILITQSPLQDLLTEQNRFNIYCPERLETAKAETIAKCIKLALSHEVSPQHIYKV